MSLVYHLPITESASLTDVRAGVTLACTRASTHAMTDDDGWLREVQANEAAFEGARFRQGLSAYSETIGAASGWNVAGSVVADSTDVSPPSGVTTIQKFDTDGLVASGVNSVTSNFAFSQFRSQHTYVLSCYARAGTNDWFSIQVVSLGAIIINGYFDLTNGVVGASVGADTVDLGIEDAGDGWYRCWIAFTNTTTDESGQIRIYNAEGDGDIGWPDKSLAGYIYVGGFMTEDVSGRWDSENLLLQSNTLDNASWQNVVSVESTGYSDPDGGTDAWRLIDNNDAALGSAFIRQIITLPEPGRYTLSFYAKSDQEDWCRPYINQLSGRTQSANFNLAAGALGTDGADTIDSTIASAGDGWYRCSMTFEATSDDLGCWVELYIGEADSDVTFASRDGTHSILLYKTQLERTKPAQVGPGTYAATTTAAVTNYSPSDYIATTTVAVSNLVGANSGLHDWPAATNVCLQSEDFSTTWTASGASAVNTDQTIAPDGSLTADQIIDDASTGTNVAGRTQSLTVTSGTNVFSVFCKADQLTWCAIETLLFDAGANALTYFDLSNGVVEGTPGHDDSGIEDYGNGWYRCWVQFTTTTDLAGGVYLYQASGDGGRVVDLDGTSSIFAWGAQVELASRPSPYIRTTTGTATRSEPDHSSSDVSWFNEAKGSIVARGKAARSGGFLVNINKDAAEYHAAFNNSTTLQYRAFVGTGTDVSINAGGGELANYVSATIAAAYEIANYTASVNGVAGTPNTTNNIPAGIIEIRLGNDANGSNSWGGLIEEVAVFDNYLTQDQLDDVSAGNITVAQLSERRASLARTLTANLTRNLARGLAN